MPPSWLRSILLSRNVLLFIGITLTYNLFPDPPAVRNAEARRTKQALERRIEERVDKYEQEHPGWLQGTWPDKSNKSGPKSN